MLCLQILVQILFLVYFRSFEVQAAKKVIADQPSCISNCSDLAVITVCHLDEKTRVANLVVKLKKPINDVIARLELFRRIGGTYKPYVVDVTFDLCDFLKHRRHSLIRLTYQYLLPYTNLNHSCPLTDEILLKDFRWDLRRATYFAIPDGEYLLKVKFSSQQRMCVIISFNFKLMNE